MFTFEFLHVFSVSFATYQTQIGITKRRFIDRGDPNIATGRSLIVDNGFEPTRLSMEVGKFLLRTKRFQVASGRLDAVENLLNQPFAQAGIIVSAKSHLPLVDLHIELSHLETPNVWVDAATLAPLFIGMLRHARMNFTVTKLAKPTKDL